MVIVVIVHYSVEVEAGGMDEVGHRGAVELVSVANVA